MKLYWLLLTGLLLAATACIPQSEPREILPDVPEGAQAVSLLGDALFAPEPDQELLKKYQQAKTKYEAAPDDADLLIWYGRRTAYLGRYREAIEIFSEGIRKHPQDPRMYRHRGHRYISIRQFDRAIRDLDRASEMIWGKDDQVEPDGMPNEKNIPVSSLHTNIWYHLGLAHYLKRDLEKAVYAYEKGLEACLNDDMKVAFMHWLYMSLRRMGLEGRAGKVVEPVHAGMEIIENLAYHKLCLLYKGDISVAQFSDPEFSDIMNDAVLYGLGNWYIYHTRREEARDIFQNLIQGKSWASFGHIAAEAEWARDFK